MIDKIKKDRRLYTVAAGASLFVAVVCAAIVIALALTENYIPMWFLLVLSAAGFYAAPFLAFSAVDRNSAIALIKAKDELGADSPSLIADKLGWREAVTERFMKKCEKWGYLSDPQLKDE